MSWVKLKRWIDCYLKRRRREWKLLCSLHSLGFSAQAGAFFGGGSEENGDGSFTMGKELTDEARAMELAKAGFAVVRRPAENS